MKDKILFILLLFVISFVCGLPHVIGWMSNGRNYNALSMTNSSSTTKEETYFYALRTKQILDGNLIPKDAHLLEHQRDVSPYLSETIPAYIMFITSKIAGSLENGFILADFSFPVVIFLLTYFFVFEISKTKSMSILCGLAIVFVRDFFVYFPYPLALLNYLFNFHIDNLDLLPIVRSFHPQISLSFFLLTIFLIFRAFKNTGFRQVLLAGIFLGLNFYNYFFYWTSLFLGIMIFFTLNFKKAHLRLVIIEISMIGLLIGLPYIILIAKFSFSPFAKDFLIRSASEFYNLPSLTFIKYLLLSFALLIIFRKKNYHVFINSILIAALFSPILFFLILKRNLEGVHFLRRVFLPVANIYYFLLFYQFVKKKLNRALIRFLVFFLCLIFIFYGFNVQLINGLKFNRYQVLKPVEKQLFDEIKKIEKNSVIGSINRSDNLTFPMKSNVFIYVPWPTLTIATTNELIERNVVINAMFYNREAIVWERDAQIFNNSNYYFNEYDEKRRASFRKTLKSKIKNLIAICKKYQLDYIVTKKNQPIKNQICFKTRIYFLNSDYIIYKTY